MIIYETMENSDKTEGRGPMVTVGFFKTEKEAVRAAKGRGVMGVGDGEVYKITVQDTADDVIIYGKIIAAKEKVYGYRRDRLGRWSEGYVDNRETLDLTEDPEYQEYLRLSKKYRRQ